MLVLAVDRACPGNRPAADPEVPGRACSDNRPPEGLGIPDHAYSGNHLAVDRACLGSRLAAASSDRALAGALGSLVRASSVLGLADRAWGNRPAVDRAYWGSRVAADLGIPDRACLGNRPVAGRAYLGNRPAEALGNLVHACPGNRLGAASWVHGPAEVPGMPGRAYPCIDLGNRPAACPSWGRALAGCASCLDTVLFPFPAAEVRLGPVWSADPSSAWLDLSEPEPPLFPSSS